MTKFPKYIPEEWLNDSLIEQCGHHDAPTTPNIKDKKFECSVCGAFRGWMYAEGESS